MNGFFRDEHESSAANTKTLSGNTDAIDDAQLDTVIGGYANLEYASSGLSAVSEIKPSVDATARKGFPLLFRLPGLREVNPRKPRIGFRGF